MNGAVRVVITRPPFFCCFFCFYVFIFLKNKKKQKKIKKNAKKFAHIKKKLYLCTEFEKQPNK